MNNAKTFTKIILAAMGIFFLIKLVPIVYQFVIYMSISSSMKSLLKWPLLLSLLTIPIIVLFLWYFFFYLRDWFAEKIVGVPTGYESIEQVPWFPAALRLICIFAGLYCLFNVVWNLQQIIYLLRLHAERGVVGKTSYSPLKEIFHLALMFVIGIYFVYGAPHFVRWQVKRTIEQCRKLESGEPVSD